MQPNRIRSIFETLVRHQAEFLVVGGVAAVLRGAPFGTLGVHVVHSTASENVTRVLAALDEMDARYRSQRDVRPSVSHLSSPSHQLLITRFGPLDLLGAIGKGRSYADLLPLTGEMNAGGVNLRVLHLEAHIAIKEEAGSRL